MAIAKELLDQLENRRQAALLGGGADKIEARHKKGLLTARERINLLFDPQTFQEIGMFAEHACHNFGMEKKSMPGDGVITGIGYINGKQVAAFAHDFTVGGGALGRVHAQKVLDLMDHALANGIPVVGVNDSGGARIQEGVESLSGYGRIFFKNVCLSGVVPQIAIIAGPCAGGAAYSPALTDFQIMTRNNANMFICGPDVIKSVTGQACTMDEIGSAQVHAAVAGNVHFVVDNDQQALEVTKKLLDFLPPNNMADPPHHITAQLDMSEDLSFNEIVPSDPKQPFDVHKVIAKLVDHADFLEVQKEFAGNLVVGFGRIQGVVVGIVANQPMVKAGTLDIDTSDKGARFIRTCNVYNIPVVSLVDVPGFLPGLNQERGGIIRHGAKMLFAYAATTTPKITLIMRKAYGGAYLAMCSKDMGADWVFAWPTAEIAVMGAEGAVRVLFKKEIDSSPDPKAKEKELATEYRDNFSSPYQSAASNMIQDVISPARTRAVIALALRNSLNKRENRPAKKHGNIPL